MSDDLAVIRFSLKERLTRRTREVAQEEVGRAFMNLDFTSLADDLSMELETRLLPGVAVTHARLSPHQARSHDPSRGDDDFTLLWSPTSGQGFTRQVGREVSADGSASLLSGAERMECETRTPLHDVTMVRLRRSVLCPLLPDAEAALMRPIPASNEALRLLNAYLAGFRTLAGPSLGPRAAHLAATHIGDLVALAIGTSGEAAEHASRRGLRAARLEAVKRWTRARLTSPELGIAAAAKAIGVSPRSVQLLFETEGVTFTGFVLRERLALAHRCLSTPRLDGRTIGEIAYGCGFGDLSYFTRSFRAAYGQTPSEARHGAMAAFADP